MKKLLLLCVCICLFFVGCTSTSSIPITPSELNYKEITGKEYCDKAGSWSSYSSNEKLTSLFLASKAYKLIDVYISGATKINEYGKDEVLFELMGDSYGNTVRVYATDFVINKKDSDPSFAERIDAVSNNKKYNGKYTVYIYGDLEGNAFWGYTTKAILYDIEGIPSQEQIDADIAAEQAEQLAKEQAEKAAKAEKVAKLDAIGKKIAQNYIYHGVAEDAKNSELFYSGALEEGHAYYISTYMVYAGGEMGGVITSLFGNPNYQYVKYINQKVKGEVVNAGKTIFGNLPISVIVAGGKAPMYIPVILGIVEE